MAKKWPVREGVKASGAEVAIEALVLKHLANIVWQPICFGTFFHCIPCVLQIHGNTLITIGS